MPQENLAKMGIPKSALDYPFTTLIAMEENEALALEWAVASEANDEKTGTKLANEYKEKVGFIPGLREQFRNPIWEVFLARKADASLAPAVE